MGISFSHFLFERNDIQFSFNFVRSNSVSSILLFDSVEDCYSGVANRSFKWHSFG